MGKSIYEKACDKLQPELLKMKSKLSFEQTIELVEKTKKSFSTDYAKVYELVKTLAFETEEKNESKTFEEIIQSLKVKKLNEFELDAAFDAICNIYDVTYTEPSELYQGKEYWMSIGRLYPKF